MVVRTYFEVFASCFLALILFAPPTFGAIEPPYKSIEYCYRIDNIRAFPDFVLVARFPYVSNGYADSIQLKEDECYVRNMRDEIVAVRKERFQASDMEAGILNSGIRTPVSPVKIYDPQDPRKKIEDIFTIDKLDDQTFSLRLAKKIITYDDGTVEEKVYTTVEEGLADPPGPGYEYTDASIETKGYPDYPPEYHQLYEEDWGKGLITLAVTLLFHLYTGAALFALARRFGIRHRWRAWIPIVNISLLIRLSEKRQNWLLVILLIPLIMIYGLYSIVTTGFFGMIAPLGLEFAFLGILMAGAVFAILFIAALIFFAWLFTALAARCGRPWWWGPLMVLVPPVGFVLLGVMAWSKKGGNLVNRENP